MIPLKNFAKINIKHVSRHLSGLKLFAKDKICDESLYFEYNRTFEKNHFDRKMFYTYCFMHIKISPTGKSVLFIILSGN